MGCRTLNESKNKIIQRIRSIAAVFLHSLIFPRRHELRHTPKAGYASGDDRLKGFNPPQSKS